MEPVARGLIVKAPWVKALAEGRKRWELRNRPSDVRGPVAILEGGTCQVVGVMEIVDCIGPLDAKALRLAARRGLILPEEIHDADQVPQYAWVVGSAHALEDPLPYRHPRGAVVWVKLDEELGETLAVSQPKPATKSCNPRA